MNNNPDTNQSDGMSQEVKEALTEAKQHIKAKEYAQARNILETINHPLAQKWLDKLPDDYDVYSPVKAKPHLDERFNQARALIKAKQYDEARDILEYLDHPKAQSWLDKIDELDIWGANTSQPHTTEVIVNSGGGAGCAVCVKGCETTS
jgi:hypothetical protein